MYDAIVVGARCAGAPTAMLLARQGYRVLLVDRATFPSDINRLHFIRPSGVALLKRWGVLDQIIASGCPAIGRYSVDLGDFVLAGTPPPIDGVFEHYAPRRTVLDSILVDAAVAAGVELRTACTVRELLWEGDRVVGIKGQERGGQVVSERASIVIGADGMHSLVARAVEAPIYLAQPSYACYYYSYWSGVPADGLEVRWRDRRLSLAFPTNDDLTCICLGWPHEEFATVRTDPERHVLAALAPELAERAAAGQRVEPLRGTGDLPNFFRRPGGPGWALVGDAGYHKDPYLAFGISDAFLSADLLARAIDAGLRGRQPMAEALATYEQQRNQAVMPLFQLNCQLARLEPPTPEQLALRAALRGDEVETSRYFGAISGTLPLQEFFAPDNLQRIMLGARARMAAPSRSAATS